MKINSHSFKALFVPLALAAMTLPGLGSNSVNAQSPGMEAPPSEVEITIRDREHGYETVGITMPSQKTIFTIRNEDSVTHGFASTLFKDLPIRVENGKEVKGKNFRSFHVDPGQTMRLYFSTAPSKFGPAGGAESLRYALWCDIHPEVKGEVYIIETRGSLGGG